MTRFPSWRWRDTGLRAVRLIAVASLAVLVTCDQLLSTKPPPPEYMLSQLFTWTPDKFVAAFGQPAFVVDVAGGRDCYWESGEQSPVEALFPDEFARRYPVSDFRLLPFCLIASFQKEQVEMVYVARSYEPPASRIGFAGESLRALKRDELLQELEPPDRTAQVGLRQEETEYSWQLSAGQNPLSALPWDYELALACDRFGRVASVRVTRSS